MKNKNIKIKEQLINIFTNKKLIKFIFVLLILSLLIISWIYFYKKYKTNIKTQIIEVYNENNEISQKINNNNIKNFNSIKKIKKELKIIETRLNENKDLIKKININRKYILEKWIILKNKWIDNIITKNNQINQNFQKIKNDLNWIIKLKFINKINNKNNSNIINNKSKQNTLKINNIVKTNEKNNNLNEKNNKKFNEEKKAEFIKEINKEIKNLDNTKSSIKTIDLNF